MPSITRRSILQTGLAAATLHLTAQTPQAAPAPKPPTEIQKRRNNIHQSVSRWCYKDIPLDDLCAHSAKIGLKGVDLLDMKDWEVIFPFEKR